MPVFRLIDNLDLLQERERLTLRVQDFSSLAELFVQRAEATPSKEAVRYKRSGRWQRVTWSEYRKEVEWLARALHPWTQSGESIALLSESRPEWVYTDNAILSLACVTVPIYPTLPLRDIAYILNEIEASIVIVSTLKQLEKLLVLRGEGKVPHLQRILCFEESVHCNGDNILSLRQLREIAEMTPLSAVEERREELDREALATIIYTSGTTGLPKGACLTHGNLLANLEGLQHFLAEAEVRDAQMLSFLPLSHAFERTLGHFLPTLMGFQVAYAQKPSTLEQDLRDIQPTLLISVPIIYEEIYNRTLREAQRSQVLGPMLEWCLDLGRKHARYIESGRNPGFLFTTQYEVADRMLFKRVRDALGGRLQWAISGGAPLSSKIEEFLLGAGITVVEGYGLSETSPALTATPPHAIRMGSVGKPLFNVEIKIQPEEGQSAPGEGEILVRGPSVMSGYHRKESETQEIFDDEGWLKTGDVGYFDQDGYLFLTDRKKELIKTAGGKYVAPQPIENSLKLSPVIQQAVVIGETRPYCTLLVSADTAALEEQLGETLKPDVVLNEREDVRLLIQSRIDEANRELGRWEQIRKFVLLPRPLSLEQGELTPTLKIKRNVVNSHFREIIDALYEES